jgi:hypothetical protein
MANGTRMDKRGMNKKRRRKNECPIPICTVDIFFRILAMQG